MMKRILGFLLTLCFALTCLGGALAEQTEPVTYNPGEITSAMFENLPSGTMTATDLGLLVTLGESTGFDADTLAAITEVLDNTTLHVSAGAYDDGVRLYLAGLYGYGESALSVDAALNITEAGLSVESNLIEGRKITVTWDTLLRMCGADDETLAALKSLSEVTEEDIASAVTELLNQLAGFAQKAIEIASPYLEKVIEFAVGLPVETLENVTEDSGYPAAAKVITITCTEKAIGDLLVALSDVLEQDAVLAPMLDQAIASGAMDITHNGVTATNTAEACALLRTAVAEKLSDESRPIQLILGTDENGVPSYLILCKEMEDGMSVAFTATMMQPDDSSFAFALSAGTHLADGSMEDGITMNLTAGIDPYNPNAVLVTTQTLGYTGNEVTVQQKQTVSVENAEIDGVPQQKLDYVLSQTQEGATVDVTMNGTAQPNESSGEDMSYEGKMTVTADDATLSTDFLYGISSMMVEDAPVASMIFAMSTPDIGLDLYGISVDCYTYEYDPATTAALEEYALDTITSDDMDVLMTQASSTAQNLLAELLQKLPEAFVAMMSE